MFPLPGLVRMGVRGRECVSRSYKFEGEDSFVSLSLSSFVHFGCFGCFASFLCCVLPVLCCILSVIPLDFLQPLPTQTQPGPHSHIKYGLRHLHGRAIGRCPCPSWLHPSERHRPHEPILLQGTPSSLSSKTLTQLLPADYS